MDFVRSVAQGSGGKGCGVPELIVPTAGLHEAWLQAHAEWGPGVHEDGFGLLPTDDVCSATGFAAWTGRLAGASDRRGALQAGQVPCMYRWIVEGDQVFGGIALRYGFGESVRRVGSIGFGIRPSARKRGLAAWALSRMLDEPSVLGMNEVLLVCASGDTASARTIERSGGVLDGSEFGPTRHYWLATAQPVRRKEGVPARRS